MRPTSRFEQVLHEKEAALFSQLLASAVQGNTVKSAFLAGQIHSLREMPQVYREAHRASDEDGEP